MSVESLQNGLLNNVVSVSQKIYKMRCCLARETDRDSFVKGAIEFSHLEGLQEGIKVAISAIEKHIEALKEAER